MKCLSPVKISVRFSSCATIIVVKSVKEMSSLSAKPQAEIKGPPKPRLGDLLNLDEWRYQQSLGIACRFLERTPAKKQADCFVQDKICRNNIAGSLGSLGICSGSRLMRWIPGILQHEPSPRIDEEPHAGFLPYNSSSMFWESVPSDPIPITSRNGSRRSRIIFKRSIVCW